MTNSDLKSEIISRVKDLAANFMYYDRKEDEEVPVDVLLAAFIDQIITVEEVLDVFKAKLNECLGR